MGCKSKRGLTMENKNYFLPADILLPKTDLDKWSVVACDQYTSEPHYWHKVEKNVSDCPSALNIVFPEVYLSDDNSARIDKINTTMRDYLNGDVFKEYENSFVYVERTVSGGKIRRGIVGLIDLENYSYEKGSHSVIRATEATVTERIPARVEIRRGAAVEIPHIMLLIDDPGKTVIEEAAKHTDDFECLYDFDLMMNGGHIKGMRMNDASAEYTQNALNELYAADDDGLLFAVGDGNHSLAAAKECYKLNKTGSSRYALVEIVNIHDESLCFEPIYRVVFGVDPQKLIDRFVDYCGGEYTGDNAQSFTCVYGENERTVSVKPVASLCVGTLQKFLDEYLANNKTVKIDYIHGEKSVYTLAENENTVGFLFNGMSKSELFTAIKKDGALPRKTFSMGTADDKRYYLEARKI